MYKERINLYQELENKLGSKLLVYITSDREGFQTLIGSDVYDLFVNHLDKIGIIDKISLYLYTPGGNIISAWYIVNLIRQYCKEFQVLIPHKAHSAGTLISIGANSIIMTKQATLSPIDPSIITYLNPPIPGANPKTTCPVSVEAVKGYIALAKEEFGLSGDSALSSIMLKLSDSVHPLVLGDVYRSRLQIKMLAEKLLVNSVIDQSKISHIVSFLCSDSGSHDYTINRKEAVNDLGLNVEKPNMEMYTIIKNIYDDISKELGFRLPYNLRTIAKNKSHTYAVKRALIESIYNGSNFFVTRGKISTIKYPIYSNVQGTQTIGTRQDFKDERIFDGWEYESNNLEGN
jgi:hypothetical protein